MKLTIFTEQLFRRSPNDENHIIYFKKYGDVKSAEDLLKKLPKFYTLKENIEHAKMDLDNFEKDLNEKEEILKNLNSETLTLEKNELFKELENKNDELFQLRIKINEHLGFKKALKKLKFELDKDSIHITNIDTNYLRDLLKNPISSLLSLSNEDIKERVKYVALQEKINVSTDGLNALVEVSKGDCRRAINYLQSCGTI